MDPTLPELAQEDVMGNSVESPAEIKVDNILCSPFMQPDIPVISL